MRKAVCIFQLCPRNVAFLFVISYSCIVVGGVSGDKPIMGIILNTLFNRFLAIIGIQRAALDTPRYTFPETLEGFGYHFSEKGELRDEKGRGFQFVVEKDNRDYNQQRYEAIGELVTEHVYKLLEKDLGLERVNVPEDASKGEAQGFIFRSKGAAQSSKLMVLIHGSGVVRAGQWSRKLIINENIDTGTQLPYIRGAMEDGFGVIVMNTNLNKASVNGKLQKIRGSESPEEHGVYVWENFVRPAKAASIAVVAHSYGGIVAYAVAQTFMADFQKRVFSVVFTDSVHADRADLWKKPVQDFMKQRAVNYVSSDKPLDSKEEPMTPDDCLSVSAGTPEHERTSHACIQNAFQFIRSCYGVWMKKGTVKAEDFFLPPDNSKSEL